MTKTLAREIAIDKPLIDSLKKEASKREQTVELLPVNEITGSTVVCLYYDVIRDLLEAHSITRGYKISNHICYVGFLTEIVGQEELAKEFDAMRRVRNGINYYGESLSTEEAEKVIGSMKQVLSQVKKLHA